MSWAWSQIANETGRSRRQPVNRSALARKAGAVTQSNSSCDSRAGISPNCHA